MAKMYYDDAADLALIQGKKVGDDRLRIAGARARAEPEGQRRAASGSACRRRAGRAPRRRRPGSTVGDVAEVTKWADVVMILVPDTTQAQGLPTRRSSRISPPGNMVMFAHGFNIRFGTITPRPDVDVSMVAPKSPGHRVRELFVEGAGTPALFAIHQDATGQARAIDAVVREGHRRHARRRHRDDLRGRDRDRSVRRAGGAVRRRERADQGRLRDAGGRRLSAGESPTSSASTS